MDTTDSAPHKPKEFYHLKFHGDTEAYFKIWLVNTVLTLLTLGAYSAWAKVRTTKYFNQATEYQGSRMDYHAKPFPILVGRMIAIVLFGLYFYGGQFSPVLGLIGALLLALTFPFVFVKSLRFKTKNTSYRNVRFSFRGTVKQAYQLGIKYFGIFIFLSVGLYLLAVFFGEIPDPQKAEEVGGMFTHPVMIGSFVALGIQTLYFVFMAPRILGALFSFIYDNLYFGGSRVRISLDENVSKEILWPIYRGIGLVVVSTAVFAGLVFWGLPVLMGYLAKNVGASALLSSIGVFSGVASVLVFYGGLFYVSLLFPYGCIRYIWRRLQVENHSSTINLRKWDYIKTAFVNLLAISFSLGLAYPWAKIRMRRLVTEAKALTVTDIDVFLQEAIEKEGALAEGVADIFDFDFEIGF